MRKVQRRVFDWIKAASIIRSTMPDSADAGLYEDWDMTSTTIFRGGKIERNDDGHLASTWATPQLWLRRGDELTCCDCYVDSDSTSWTDSTRWPEEAVAKLHGVPCQA